MIPLDRDPVRDDRVAALRHEPETPVLEHEDRRHHSGDSFVEGVDRSLDRRGRIVVGADLLRRSVRGRGEQTGVDRPDERAAAEADSMPALSALAARC